MSFAAPERWVWWRIWCEPGGRARAGRIGAAEVVAGCVGGGGPRGVPRLAVGAAARKSAGSCRVRGGGLSSRRDSGAVGSVRESGLRRALVSLGKGRQARGQGRVAGITAAAGDPATAHGLCGGRLPALGDLQRLVRLTQAPVGRGGPTGPGAASPTSWRASARPPTSGPPRRGGKLAGRGGPTMVAWRSRQGSST